MNATRILFDVDDVAHPKAAPVHEGDILGEHALRIYSMANEEHRKEALRFAFHSAEQFILTFLPEPEGCEPGDENAHIGYYLENLTIVDITPGLARLEMGGHRIEARLCIEGLDFYLAQACGTCHAVQWNWIASPEILGWHLANQTYCPSCSGVHRPFEAFVRLSDLDKMTATLAAASRAIAHAKRFIRDAQAVADDIKDAFLGAYEAEGASVTERKEDRARALGAHEPYRQALAQVQDWEDALAEAEADHEQAEQAISLYRAFLYSKAPARH